MHCRVPPLSVIITISQRRVMRFFFFHSLLPLPVTTDPRRSAVLAVSQFSLHQCGPGVFLSPFSQLKRKKKARLTEEGRGKGDLEPFENEKKNAFQMLRSQNPVPGSHAQWHTHARNVVYSASSSERSLISILSQCGPFLYVCVCAGSRMFGRCLLRV